MQKKEIVGCRLHKIIMLLGMIFLWVETCSADIAVIVNPVNAGMSLTRSTIQEIFLGVQGKFPNGSPASPIDQSDDKPVRQAFYQLVAGKTPVQMKSYWSRLIFTGKGTPPPAIGGDSAVLSYVASNKNAIGYVDSSAAKEASNVKIIFLIPTQ